MSRTDTWMPLYIADYLADTMHLNTAQHGAYVLLLMHHWRTGPLPDDDAQLASIARCDLVSWKKSFAPIIRRFFTVSDVGLTQKRLLAEQEFAEELTDMRSVAGKAGAAKRWGKGSKRSSKPGGETGSGGSGDGKDHSKVDGEPMANAMANASQPASQTDTPSPSSLRSETVNPPTLRVVPPKRKSRVDPNWMPNEAGVEKATAAGIVSVSAEATKFRDYHTGKGNLMADWDAAWRTWVGNYRAPPRPIAGAPAPFRNGFAELQRRAQAQFDEENNPVFKGIDHARH